MQRSIYVPLPEGASAALRDLARRELRDPRAQAAMLVIEGLRRAGFEPADAAKRPAR
ncbi:MAG TPA: hypothetical protein VIK08_09060 [Candidatus Limnocylindrales bacterium]